MNLRQLASIRPADLLQSLAALALSGLLVLPAHSSPSQDVCTPLLMGSSVGHKKQKNNLLDLGFQRVDRSNFYQRGGFLVELKENGAFQLYSSVNPLFSSPDFNLAAIKRRIHIKGQPLSEQSELILFFEGRQAAYTLSFTHNASESGSYRPGEVLLPTGTLRAQFLAAGAEQDPQHTSLAYFHLHPPRAVRPANLSADDLGSPAPSQERILIAVFDKNDQLMNLYTPVSDALIRDLSSKAIIAGYRLGTTQYGDVRSLLEIADGKNLITISDEYYQGHEVTPTQKLGPDEEQMAILLQEIFQQSKKGRVKVNVEDVSGKVTTEDFKGLFYLAVNSDGTLGASLEHPQSSNEVYFQGRFHLVADGDRLEEIVISTILGHTIFSNHDHTLKRMSIRFENPIHLNPIVLSRLTSKSDQSEMVKLTRLIEQTYAQPQSDPMTLNFYGLKTTKSLKLSLMSAKSHYGAIRLEFAQGEFVMGTLKKVLVHDDHSEVILKVRHTERLPISDSDELRLNFMLPMGTLGEF